jgi:ATP-dependent helicase/nuclease subunit B
MKFITGRCGSGKTTYCLNEIKNCLEQGCTQPMIYIVPEQFSFEAERNLISATNNKGIIDVQVLSFKRLAYKVFLDNNIVHKELSSSTKSIVLFNIMCKFEKELLVLKGVTNNIGLVNTVSDEISELKRYGITPLILENTHVENEFLSMKLHDICLIYKEYEEAIKDRFIDDNDNLTILKELLKSNSDILKNAKIWIDEFDGFIPQEMNIIQELDNRADVTICITTGDEDFFSINNDAFNQLLKVSQKNFEMHANSSNFESFKESNIIRLGDSKRYISDELKHLEQNLYKANGSKYQGTCNNIFITKYDNAYDEINAVAKKIRELVSSYRYDNIQILTRDINKYKNIIKRVFPFYEISFL